MLKSVLLHVDGDDRRTVGIPAIVHLAARHAARVRGLTILDTRRIIAAAAGCLSAVHAADEGERLQQQEQQQASVLSELTRECLRSGVDFDVRRLRGDPLELLPQEARFHDLIVASWPTAIEPDRDLGAIRTFTELGLRGAQPLLVLRAADRDLQRLLLIYDGSAPSERAIKTFLSLNLYPEADVRLLAIGRTDDEARRNLAEMAEYVRPLRSQAELGRTSGALRKVVANYIQKWGADLVVLGIPRRDGLLSRLWGDAVADALRDTTAAVYMSG